MIARRGFLRLAGGLIAAPAIVRVASIMPVKAMPSDDVLELIAKRWGFPRDLYRSEPWGRPISPDGEIPPCGFTIIQVRNQQQYEHALAQGFG
jgi:hypothetical protein